jgi:uncharacterized protein DUF4193
VDDLKGTMKDTEEPVEEDDAAEEDDLEDVEPTEADLDEAVVPAEPPEPVDSADPAAAEVESIQDLLVKQEARAEEEEADDEDEAAVALTRDDRLEPADTRVVPMQTTEFVCKRCFLVKHRSQLADKKRTLCRDCA